MQAYFRIYLEHIIPHTPKGFAYPYHFGAMRPTTQVCSTPTPPHPAMRGVSIAMLLIAANYDRASQFVRGGRLSGRCSVLVGEFQQILVNF